MAKGVIGYGNNMGEGWLLTAEMLELVHSGYTNIICAQPFGCLPNHIAGRGMINKSRRLPKKPIFWHWTTMPALPASIRKPY